MSEVEENPAVTEGDANPEGEAAEGAQEEAKAPVPEPAAEEEEAPALPQKNVLSKETCAQGLSNIEMIADGSTYAYTELNLESKGIDLLGETL